MLYLNFRGLLPCNTSTPSSICGLFEKCGVVLLCLYKAHDIILQISPGVPKDKNRPTNGEPLSNKTWYVLYIMARERVHAWGGDSIPPDQG